MHTKELVEDWMGGGVGRVAKASCLCAPIKS